MSSAKTLAAALATVAVTATAANAAEAPVVSPQQQATARTAPVTFPGTGVHKGERLPSGARIVFREVTLERGQQVRLSLRAPEGKRLKGLGIREGGKVGFHVVRPKGSYAGRKRVVLRASGSRLRQETTERVYALTR